jgi:hypothetical protein
MLNMCAITPPGDCPPFISINYHDCVKDEPYEGGTIHVRSAAVYSEDGHKVCGPQAHIVLNKEQFEDFIDQLNS